ncbi:MAG: family acetyltransferase [Bacteroidetes bacterium]|jgi:GNAT superfamily N-acetyltransferase|nr:family acetyltransferase [Bacteroidota bacterium]
MIRFQRTDFTNDDFKALTSLLDADLKVNDGDDHAFFAQFNKIDDINQVIVVYNGDNAVGCGAIKPYEVGIAEVKRMFVREDARGQGIGASILSELEKWAYETGFQKTILETGKKQKEAVRLYQRMGYNLIPNYGQYVGVESSVCMTKDLSYLK